MTVAELIEQLQKYPSDTEVVYYYDGSAFPTDVPFVDSVSEHSIFGYDSKKLVKIY